MVKNKKVCRKIRKSNIKKDLGGAWIKMGILPVSCPEVDKEYLAVVKT
ncbi:hypothetical protein [Methanosarcina sp. KYL-1]|nr:hypothetical protein [Methanosarcina sp. KYL-1]